MTVSFSIEKIEGREPIQKNFARLPEKSAVYSGRHPSLNERFAVMERGYYLKPDLSTLEKQAPTRECYLIPVTSQLPTTDVIKEKLIQKKAERELKLAQKLASSASEGSPKSTTSMSP